MNLSPPLVWFLIGVFLIVAEFVVPGVILIFFGLGAWAAALSTYVGLTTTTGASLIVFAVSSVVSLFALRKWVKNQFMGHVGDNQDPAKDMDEFKGTRVCVLEDILPGTDQGRVEFKGASWKACAPSRISVGELAVITSVEGITLNVQAIETEKENT